MGNFQYTGNLEETFLTDTFAVIFQHNVPGIMEISRDDCWKRIYVHGGNVVHAISSDRADRLGSHLYRSGLLTRDDLLETVRERDHSDKRHGQLLIEKGLLSPKELYEAIRGQMESIVWSVFSWQKGQVTFKIGELDGAGKIRIHLPMRQVIVRGIKEVADTKSLVARLGTKSTVFRPVYTTENLIELALDRDEYALLSLIDGQRRFFDVCNQGPFGMSGNARLIYAFRLLGLVDTVEPAPGQGAGVKIRLGGESSV
ncbi:MAG TPA: DUF4388 domain-containing protein [Thermoanaerobaculia bacterium]|jgi:hypothetical protein